MHLKSKDRKAKTKDKMNASLRQVVGACSNFTKMEEQIKNIWRTKPNLYGEEAKTTEGI